MVFGLFKKKASADLIFTNGKIYTQNPDMEWAEAIACKGSEVVFVGYAEDAEAFDDGHTEVVNLEGRYVFPGFTETQGNPIKDSFIDEYVSLSENDTDERVCEKIAEFIKKNPQRNGYLAYGCNEKIYEGKQDEEVKNSLDSLISDKPLVILERGERRIRTNTLAKEMVDSAADIDGVQLITLTYILQSLELFDYDQLQKNVLNVALNLCEKGYTSVYDNGCPEFMDNIYRDILSCLHLEGMLKQRNFTCVNLRKGDVGGAVVEKIMQRQTLGTEMDDLIHCNTLKVPMAEKGDEDDKALAPEDLDNVIMPVCDRNMDIHVQVKDKETLKDVFERIEKARNSGYKKNIFIIDCMFASEGKDGDIIVEDDTDMQNIYLRHMKSEENNNYMQHIKDCSVEEAIDMLTSEGALLLDFYGQIGSIEEGKYADMVVFDKNPLDCIGIEALQNLKADMTVLGGEIVYTRGEDTVENWCETMNY